MHGLFCIPQRDVDPIDDGGPGVTVGVGANFHDPKEYLSDAILDAASGAIDASGFAGIPRASWP